MSWCIKRWSLQYVDEKTRVAARGWLWRLWRRDLRIFCAAPTFSHHLSKWWWPISDNVMTFSSLTIILSLKRGFVKLSVFLLFLTQLTRHKAMMTIRAFFYELCSDNILLLAWSRKLAFLTPPSRQGSLLQLFLAPNIWKYPLNTNYAGTHIHLWMIIYIHPLRPPVCQQLADNYRILKLFKSHITAWPYQHQNR